MGVSTTLLGGGDLPYSGFCLLLAAAAACLLASPLAEDWSSPTRIGWLRVCGTQEPVGDSIRIERDCKRKGGERIGRKLCGSTVFVLSPQDFESEI